MKKTNYFKIMNSNSNNFLNKIIISFNVKLHTINFKHNQIVYSNMNYDY